MLEELSEVSSSDFDEQAAVNATLKPNSSEKLQPHDDLIDYWQRILIDSVMSEPRNFILVPQILSELALSNRIDQKVFATLNGAFGSHCSGPSFNLNHLAHLLEAF